MIKYINIKNVYGTETVDELNSSDFKNLKEFKKELKRLLKEYIMAGYNCYISQRCNKTWKQ